MTDQIPDQPPATVDIVNWDDPCARAKALRTAYFDRLQGGTTTKVRFKSAENEQQIETSVTLGSLEKLRAEMIRAEDECLASQGKKSSRRFAITGGSYRDPYRR